MTSRTARRRLSTAITAVLAVTAGTALAAAPSATAAPALAPAAVAAPGDTAKAQDVAELPVRTEITSAGPGGYLTSTEQYDDGTYSYDYYWHRPDGTSTLVVAAWGRGPALPNAAVSDIVPVPDDYDYRVIRLRDMSAPAGTAPVVFDLAKLNKPDATYRYVGTIGSTLLVQVTKTAGKELHLLTKSGDTITDRPVTGLPASIDRVEDVRGTADAAFLAYRTTAAAGDKTGVVTVDLATAAAGTARPTSIPGWNHPFAIDGTHLAWWQDGTTLVTADRAGGAPKPVTLPWAERPAVGLVGGWVLHGTATEVGGGTAGDPELPLTARPLAGGDPVKVLDRMSSLTAGPDGSLLVRGGTVEHGEGVYRVTVGADGTPAAELVASTGEDTALTLKKTNVGPVVDLDPQNNRITMSWDLSHPGYAYEVRLVHKKTGRLYRYSMTMDYAPSFSFLWRGNFAVGDNDPGKSAFNGDYRWELDAKPTNGIGPDLHTTGDFTVVRSPKVHDFGDNGSPDLLVTTTDGNLYQLDTAYDVWKRKVVPVDYPNYVSAGWKGYQLTESVGNVGGTSAPDVVGRDASGGLWLHPGTGDERSPLGPRVKIGTGWGVYDKLAGGSDLDGDGRADLVATDTAGALWFYKGTGNATSPFAPRKKIGTGWGIYNQLTATGNIAGAAAGDLVARDKDGVLWLYLGKGDGTFAPRVKIGGGWNQYTQIAAVGDATMDGRNDLYVFGPDNTSYVYAGTGSWSAPFATRVPTDALTNTSLRFTNVL
ncbi:FG-GAP repeat domain-containing protein [Streptomyces sp. NPDC096319]|uniref:FG-GAP repeat domain-containing protein n=1 Tax=Streptomyces sp. NPDC096319 TaxID=3366084 RepID=UPI0037F651B7